MYESEENISKQIVRDKTEGILEMLAPKFEIDCSKISEIAAPIVDRLLQCETINKLAVTSVVKETVPIASQLLSNLADKFYDCLLSCKEEERAEVMKKFMKGATKIATEILIGVVICAGGSVAKVGIVQHGKTQRTEIRWGTLRKFSPGEIIKSWR